MAQRPMLGALPPLRAFFPLPLPPWPTMTSCPTLRSPPRTSVALPSVRPSLSATGWGSPSGPRIHTRPPTPLRPLSPVERSDLDLRSLDLSSLDLVSPPGGRNRRAAFATLSTLGF